jgi:hypothetical protein
MLVVVLGVVVVVTAAVAVVHNGDDYFMLFAPSEPLYAVFISRLSSLRLILMLSRIFLSVFQLAVFGEI